MLNLIFKPQSSNSESSCSMVQIQGLGVLTSKFMLKLQISPKVHVQNTILISKSKGSKCRFGDSKLWFGGSISVQLVSNSASF